MTKETVFKLKPQGKVLGQYMKDRSRVSIIIGALGSGKTVQTCQKIFTLMCEQEPDEGVRKSRWYAVRNTYGDLINTTIKDWRALFDGLGVYKAGGMAPPSHTLNFWLEDGTKVESEIVFIALDREDSIKKLRGSQVTGFWLNELKELSKSVIDMADLRHGRYPANPSWYGMLADTNAPDVDHWLYLLAEKQKPEGWAFFKQPGGVYRNGTHYNGKVKWEINPDAENLRNLPAGYYEKGMNGKSDDWIAVNLANEYGFVSDGKPIYPEYRDDFHNQPIQFIEGLPIYRGWDFGTPACVLVQHTPLGQLAVLREFCSNATMGIDRFADFVKKECASLYAKEYEFIDVGDPAGNQRSQQKEGTTCFSVLAERGIYIQPGKQDVDYRLESVRLFLGKLVDGYPGFVLNGEQCPVLRRGFQGGYKFRRLQVAGEKYTDKPDKTPESHPHDALQYVCSYLRGGDIEEEDYDEFEHEDELNQMGY